MPPPFRLAMLSLIVDPESVTAPNRLAIPPPPPPDKCLLPLTVELVRINVPFVPCWFTGPAL